jgi:hypothetical protein
MMRYGDGRCHGPAQHEQPVGPTAPHDQFKFWHAIPGPSLRPILTCRTITEKARQLTVMDRHVDQLYPTGRLS